MDAAVVAAIVSAVGATIVALGSLAVSLWHARKLATLQREADRERLQFEARERRYEDRRDAVIALDATAAKVIGDSVDFEQRYGFLPDEVDSSALDEALARVVMLVPSDTSLAAQALYLDALGVLTGEPKDAYDSWQAKSQPAFRAAANQMLSADQGEPASQPYRASLITWPWTKRTLNS